MKTDCAFCKFYGKRCLFGWKLMVDRCPSPSFAFSKGIIIELVNRYPSKRAELEHRGIIKGGSNERL